MDEQLKVLSIEGVESATEERATLHPGLGMMTMKRRSQAVGAKFEVRTVPGHGARLTMRVQA
jgi:signal transduction histidine kinase